MGVLLHLMMFLDSLNLFSLFYYFFFLLISFFSFHYPVFQIANHSASSNLLLIPSIVFSNFSYWNLHVWLAFLYFLFLSWNLHWVYLLLFSNPASIFITITSNSSSDILLISISFSFFALILSYGFIWDIFFYLFILSLCLCVLGQLRLLVFKVVALCRRDPVVHNLPYSLEPSGLHVPYCCGWAIFGLQPSCYNDLLCLLLVHWAGCGTCVVERNIWSFCGLTDGWGQQSD